MPSSQLNQIPTIIEAVIELKPTTILDVGMGCGKYGLLCREYLEYWKGLKCKIDGIEGCSEYITDIQMSIYDNVICKEALEALGTIDSEKYDLVLAVDIVEHFDKEKGKQFLSELFRVGKNIIISTPKIVSNQDAIFGNELERHRSAWTPRELSYDHNYVILKDLTSHIVFAGPNAKPLKRGLAYLKFRILREGMNFKAALKSRA
jgi:2-polyprenyl-3-methyl-5-hydroxy-6-metoxy-1,4-benzoquinol methylase